MEFHFMMSICIALYDQMFTVHAGLDDSSVAGGDGIVEDEEMRRAAMGAHYRLTRRGPAPVLVALCPLTSSSPETRPST